MKEILNPPTRFPPAALRVLAEQGKDVSHFFKGQGRRVQRVNVDLTASRQVVIKTLVRQALDQHYLAQQARRP